MSTTSTAKAGRTDADEVLHAVRPGLTGPRAVCAAGPITSRVLGRFHPATEGICPAGAAQVR